MLAEPLMIGKQGYVQVPGRSGFGLVIDEDRVAHHTVHVIECGDCRFAAKGSS
jgi:L-alanine-DL-glutamate epimerase-like enolase superfamily enzyme